LEISSAAAQRGQDAAQQGDIAIQIVPRDVSGDELGRRVTLEIGMTKGGDIQCGAEIHAGETLIQATRHAFPPDEALGAGQTYLVVTPEIVE
jgi:hypothetical protein